MKKNFLNIRLTLIDPIAALQDRGNAVAMVDETYVLDSTMVYTGSSRGWMTMMTRNMFVTFA